MIRYPEAAGHNETQTSTAAARELDNGGRDRQLDFCEGALYRSGVAGMIAEELKEAMNDAGFRNIERSQAAARLSDLTAKDVAYSTDRSRRSGFSGKEQMVYVHRTFATTEDKVFHEGRARTRGRKNTEKVVQIDAAAARQLAEMLMGLVWEHRKDGGARIDLTPLDLHIAIGLARRAGIKGGIA